MNLDNDLISIQEVRDKVHLAAVAQKSLEQLSQAEIDSIVRNMSEEAAKAAEMLARLAVEETGFGNVQDKVTKNLFAAQRVHDAIKDMKTVGIIQVDEGKKVWEIAEPVGVIAGIIPSTNPTSTIIFKALIAIKARNAIVFSPHPAALNCSLQAVKIMNDAAIAAGAPEGAVQGIEHSSLDASRELMSHIKTNLILATGGPGMVKAAYSSGKPAYGVGPGNVPVYVHKSANITRSARQIIESKAFDYGTICASEQAVVVDEEIKDRFLTELQKKGAYFLNPAEKEKVAGILLKNNSLNTQIVGRSPLEIAELAGIGIPEGTKILVGEEEDIGKNAPFSLEKLSTVLAFYTVKDWQEGCEISMKLLEVGGLGHTIGIHANEDEVILAFALKKPASRVIVNSGTTFGGIGATTGIFPSMTLGCGTYGNNITTDNIGPQHLLNIKRVAFGIREMDNNSQQIELESSEGEISVEEITKIVMQVISQLT
ncbi:acetaldehyde dehydrogenase (acetylating) [Neobacillus sp. FSL H8-0543]|uniref:acetaldehyde dehydrogenase (acetylating) n=1 Tax=Neobacillus sp. FSL H8-0543 TaxID=2954672 RepID=UPI003158400D